MKITVDRLEGTDGLTFVIRVTEPHDVPFTKIEMETMHVLEDCKDAVERLHGAELPIINEVVNAIHNIKRRAFDRAYNSLTFEIRNTLNDKWIPICQEIYNWIYDHQKPMLKEWMQEFDPQRTKYYFDNDKTVEKCYEEQESEHDE